MDRAEGRGRSKPSGYGVGGQFLVAQCGLSRIVKVRKEIGANVQSFRKRAGLRQKKLGEKADLHPVSISEVERGTKAVSVEALWKLSRALRVRMASLLRGV